MDSAKLISVWSAHGSPGRTTIAIGIAASIADSGKKVFLLDADTYAPSIDLALGLVDHPAGLAAACRLISQDRLTLDELQRLSSQISFGSGSITFMSGLSNSSRWPEASVERVDEVLTFAGNHFDFVVVDVAAAIEPAITSKTNAADRNGISRWAIAYSDAVVTVCGADPVSINRYLAAIANLSELAPRGELFTVINRLRNSVIGLGAKQQISETLSRLGQVQIDAYIPDDPAAADAAIRGSVPITHGKRNSQARLALELFVKTRLLDQRNDLDRRVAKHA